MGRGERGRDYLKRLRRDDVAKFVVVLVETEGENVGGRHVRGVGLRRWEGEGNGGVRGLRVGCVDAGCEDGEDGEVNEY